MKKIIGITLLSCALGLTGMAQKAPARIHFLNTQQVELTAIRMAANPDKPILIKGRVWAVFETMDSLGVMIDDKPYYMHFEPGKQYYFVGQTGYGSRIVITEKTEREFIFTASLNGAKGPKEFRVEKIDN